jgi:hypothetical protein
MHPAPTTPLGQAFAAIIHLLIAAIAEHAREHPLLAGGCRASIRQLEKLARRFDAMVAEWQASQAEPRRPGVSPPRRPAPRSRQATRMVTQRRSEAPSRARCVAIWNRLPSARAPPASAMRPVVPETPPGTPRTGAAPMYAIDAVS